MHSTGHQKLSAYISINVLTTIFFALILFCYPKTTLATNHPCGSSLQLANYKIGPTSINANLVIDQNAPIYSQIGNEITASGVILQCVNPIPSGITWVFSIRANYGGGIKIGNKTVFPTSEPGIGIAIGIEDYTLCNTGTLWISAIANLYGNPMCNISGMRFSTSNAVSSLYGTYHFIFYKLANTIRSPGTAMMLPVETATYDVATSAFTYDSGIWFGSSVSFQSLTIPTCAVRTPSITVPLGTVQNNSFKGIGSVSATQNFQIGLSCSGGSSGTSTNTYITFTDNNQPGNTSTTLTLAGGSGAATGLGLQILNGSTPIGYGPDSNAPGNTNQWKVANISQGVSSYAIPLGVRYIQTGSTVTPGTVTGRATFTMSYQ